MAIGGEGLGLEVFRPLGGATEDQESTDPPSTTPLEAQRLAMAGKGIQEPPNGDPICSRHQTPAGLRPGLILWSCGIALLMLVVFYLLLLWRVFFNQDPSMGWLIVLSVCSAGWFAVILGYYGFTFRSGAVATGSK